MEQAEAAEKQKAEEQAAAAQQAEQAKQAAEQQKAEEAKAAAEEAKKPKEAPKPAVRAEEMSAEEKEEKEFPTEWIKKDVAYNVDKDQMKTREDSVEAAVREQQAWNTKTESWLETKAFRLRRWGHQ